MTSDQAHGKTRVVDVVELLPGMQLLAIVEQTGNVKLKHAGVISDVQSIDSLQRLGVKRVEISIAADSEQAATTPMKLLLQHDKRERMQSLDETLRGHNLFIPNAGNHRRWVVMQARRYTTLLLLFSVATMSGWIMTSKKDYWHEFTSDWFDSTSTNTSIPSTQPVNTPGANSAELPDELSSKPSVGADDAVSEASSMAMGTNLDASKSNTEDNDSEGQTIDEEPMLIVGAPLKAPLPSRQTLQPTEQSSERVTGEQDEPPQLNLELLRQVESVANELSDDTGSEQPALSQNDKKLDTVSNDSTTPDERLTSAADEPQRSERIKVTEYRRLDELPAAILTRLPAMVFDAHMYSTIARDRWVKVNQTVVREGDVIAPGVKLVEIEPNQVILNFEQYRFVMPALSEW